MIYIIGIYGSLIWSKSLMELIFNPCGEFRWSAEGPVNQIHSLHLLVGASGIFSDLLRFVQMLKREWGAESNGSYCTYSSLVKLQPRFLSLQNKPSLGRIAALVSEFQWRTWWYIYIYKQFWARQHRRSLAPVMNWFLLSSDIRSEESIAIVKIFDLDFLMIFYSASLPESKNVYK